MASCCVQGADSRSTNQEMDFQKLLLDIDQSLHPDEVRAMAFLCKDISQRSLESVEHFTKLCTSLSDQALLSHDRPQLVQELLLTIKRRDLVSDSRLSQDQPKRDLISAYRRLLYDISEEVSDDDLRKIKFLLNKKLPKKTLEGNVTPLGIFLKMEQMGHLGQNNLDLLQLTLKSVCPMLNEKINSFKQQQGTLVNFPEKPVASVYTGSANVKEEETYPMTSANRGFCLIINNYSFSDGSKREGTQLDQELLAQVFQWLDFKVEVHWDCTAAKMLSVSEELSKRDHGNMDCVACCFLSHGLEGGIYGVDGLSVTIRELTTLFNGTQCPSLVDKPKLFFIQACQGTKVDQAAPIQADGPTQCRIESDASKIVESIPSEADFLMGMATVPSFVSYRVKKSGSWFIQALCKNLVQMVPRGSDLVSILTKVNADVSQKTHDKGPKKQMPQPAFSLRKKVIFPVPASSPPNLPQ